MIHYDSPLFTTTYYNSPLLTTPHHCSILLNIAHHCSPFLAIAHHSSPLPMFFRVLGFQGSSEVESKKPRPQRTVDPTEKTAMPDKDKKDTTRILERQFCVEKHRKCAEMFFFSREPRSESKRKVNILKLWYLPHFKGIADKATLQRRAKVKS